MKDLKDKNEKDLQKMLQEKRESIQSFRFGVAGSKVRNVREGRNLKKDVARIMTEISSRKNKEIK